MEHCVRYALSADEVTRALQGFAPSPAKLRGILNGSRWEVWQGLPRAYEFCKIPCKNGKTGLLAAPKGVYIWVAPEAYETLDKAPNKDEVVLMVYCDGDPEKRRRCDVFAAGLADNDLKGAVAHARQLNKEIMRGKI